MINTINTPTSQGRPNNGKAMTMAIRKMSLATRGDVDQLARLRAAKEQCAQPVKLSWENVNFSAWVPSTKAEKAATNENHQKRVIVNNVSGFAPPG